MKTRIFRIVAVSFFIGTWFALLVEATYRQFSAGMGSAWVQLVMSYTLCVVGVAGIPLTDGGKMSCAVGSGVVVSDAISVTSTTAGAAFLVIWQ